MKHILSTLVILLVYSQIKGELFDDDVTVWQETCQERFCFRIYNPLCISLDGVDRTMVSRCHLENFRCRVMKQAMRTVTEDLPVIRIQHEGECEDENSIEEESEY